MSAKRRINFFSEISPKEFYIKCLVHGLSGTGKTKAIGTLRAGEALWVNPESRTLTLSGTATHGANVSSIAELQEVYQYLLHKEDKGQYKWICLDSVYDICECALLEEKKAGKNNMLAYGEMANTVLQLIRNFRDLPRNIYMTTRTETVQDDVGALFHRPAMPGQKLGPNLAYYFDLVMCARTRVDDDGKTVYRFQTQQDEAYLAKDCSGALPKFVPPNLQEIEKIMRKKVLENG